MRNLPVIAGRDLGAYFRTPAGWAVAALFLTLQGVVIWLFIQFLGRPDAPPGAVMEFFFGGTILFWIALALLATVVPMRLLSEELRTGTVESLLTAPVTLGEVVVGKWLAAVGFFVALWSPTLLYLVYLRAVGAAMDPGPIASGYLGTLLVGAAALALGLLSSALTRNQLVAATLSFVAFFVVLLLGILETQVSDPDWARLLRRFSLFRVMEDFGHGIVDSRHLVFLGSATVLGLLGATGVLALRTGRLTDRASGGGGGRWPLPPRVLTPLVLTPLLVLSIVGMLNYLAGRHYVRGDWTRSGVYALSEKTINILRALDRPVDVTVFLYPRRGSEESRALGGLVRELCDRFHRFAPSRFRVEFVDPDRAPQRAEALQRQHGIGAFDMNEGVIIFSSGGRSKYVTKDDLVEHDLAGDGAASTRFTAWKGEPAFVHALLTVTDDHPPVVCFVTGHGEPDPESIEDGGYATFAEDVRRDGNTTRSLDRLQTAGVPPDCTVLVIAEPQSAYDEAEQGALGRFLDGGGRLLMMLGPLFNAAGTGFAQVGLEPLMASWGVKLGQNLVVDPEHASDIEGPSVWATTPDGYSSHPIAARVGGRVTYWPRTREVTPAPSQQRAASQGPIDVHRLVSTSEKGWGETDLVTIRGERDLTFDKARDRAGPVDVAVAVVGGRATSSTRLVVLGTGRLVMNYRLSSVVLRDYNGDLALSAIAWLADREPRVGIGPKVPEQVKVTLKASTVAWAFRLFVVGVPALCLLTAAVVWRRRRS